MRPRDRYGDALIRTLRLQPTSTLALTTINTDRTHQDLKYPSIAWKAPIVSVRLQRRATK